MNKKIFFNLAVTAIIAGIVLTTAACAIDGTANGTVHTHDWGAWTVEIEPSCTETGKGTRTCNTCGKSDSQTAIPMIDHS